MDKQNLVEELQKAFSGDAGEREEIESDVEYRENTKTLVVKGDRTYQMIQEPKEKKMSEEEVFERLLQDRRH